MLTIFNIIVFFHIVFAIMWVGSAAVLEILEFEASRASKRERLITLLNRSSWFGMRVFGPCALLTLLTGIAAVAVGRPTFGQWWVIMALVGVALVTAIGAGVIGRTSAKLAALLAGGAPEDEVEDKLAAMRGYIYLDLAILFFILFDMVIKPVGLNVGFFTISAVFFIAVFAFIFFERRAHSRSISHNV